MTSREIQEMAYHRVQETKEVERSVMALVMEMLATLMTGELDAGKTWLGLSHPHG